MTLQVSISQSSMRHESLTSGLLFGTFFRYVATSFSSAKYAEPPAVSGTSSTSERLFFIF